MILNLFKMSIFFFLIYVNLGCTSQLESIESVSKRYVLINESFDLKILENILFIDIDPTIETDVVWEKKSDGDLSYTKLVGPNFEGSQIDIRNLGEYFNGYIRARVSYFDGESMVTRMSAEKSVLFGSNSDGIAPPPPISQLPSPQPNNSSDSIVFEPPPQIIFDLTLPPPPTWLESLPRGVWTQIGSNTVNDVNYGLTGDYFYERGFGAVPSIMNAWSGGIFATYRGQSGQLVVYGGGHRDYWGNETYGFDLEKMAWEVISKPYTGEFFFDLPDGLFPDGTPGPMHTYNRIQYWPKNNSLYIFGRELNSQGGYTKPAISYLNLTDPNGASRANWTNLPNTETGNLGSGSSSCYDENLDVMWFFGKGTAANNVTMLDLVNGKTTNFHKTTFMNGALGDDVYYSTGDCAKGLFVYASMNTSKILAMDLENIVNGTLKPFELKDGVAVKAPGFQWSKRRQAFLLWKNGETVEEFKFLGGDSRSPASWKLRNLGITGAIENIPTVNKNGTYGRFRIAAFNNGEEIAVLVNRTNEKVYVFKVP